MSKFSLIRHSSATSIYDTSIGAGVDISGFANLPLRSGAKRFFVNSVGGSDSHTSTQAQDPTTPMATIAGARAYMSTFANSGDQLMIAEGSSYSEAFVNLYDVVGNGLLYPTVFQSYDPNDPLNSSKWGRAGAGKRPLINTGANGDFTFLPGGGSAPLGYYAFRGLNWSPGNITDAPGLSIFNVGEGVLVENCVFSYTGIGFQRSGAASSDHHIIRNCSLFGSWSTTGTAGHGMFIDGIGLTVEDCALYHCGWKIGASRDDLVSAGGTAVFKHPIYLEYTAGTSANFRRNLVMEGSADGGKFIAPSFNVYDNLFIKNPLIQLGGASSDYSVENPNGHQMQIYRNAIIGSNDVNSSNVRGLGLYTFNGAPGSSFHHNLTARSGSSLAAGHTFSVGADYNIPTIMSIHDNVSYLQNNSGLTIDQHGTFASTQIFTTYANNIWDDPTSGTNTNVGSVTLPNPYTLTSLYSALTPTFSSVIDEASFIAYIQASPEGQIHRLARNLLMAGYGNGLS